MAHNTKPKDEGDQEEDVEMAEAEEEEDEDGEEETVDDEVTGVANPGII